MATSGFSDLEGLAELEYIEPKTTKEACSLLAQHGERAKVIAGGTKLLASIQKWKVSPGFIINLKSIPELEYINYSDTEGLRIGALTTLTHLEHSPIVREKFAIIAQAVHEMKPERIPRWVYYMATIGGTLAAAVPSADVIPSLIVLGARARIEGAKGWSTSPLEEFFTGRGQTILHSDEILAEVQIPAPPADSGVVFMKSPATKDVPATALAVLLTLDARHVDITDLKIVLGGIAPTPIRAHNAEDTVKGKAMDERSVGKVAQAMAKEVSSISGVPGAAIQQLVDEAMTQAFEQAIGEFALGY